MCRGYYHSLEACINQFRQCQFDRKLAIIDANTHKVITARERSKVAHKFAAVALCRLFFCLSQMVLIHPRINPEESDFDGGRIDITFPEDSGCKDFAIPLNPCKETLETWTRYD